MAASNIGKWSAQATVDARGFTSGIQRMTSSIKGFVGSQGMGLIANLPATLGLASIEGIFSRLNDTLERELDLGFLADQLGAPLGMLQQLRAIASENSVDAAQFTSAMERMNQVLGQARLGSEEAVETFGRLGISIEDIRSQDFQTLFLRAARGLDGMTDRAARARTAMELFGRRGAGQMLRFIRDIDGALADMQERGIGLGAEEALEDINDLDNAIDRLSTRWDEFWRSALAKAAPVLTQLIGETETAFTDPLGIREGVLAIGGVTSFERPPAWFQSSLNDAISAMSQQPGGGPSGGFGGTGFMLGMGTFGAVLESATNAARELANAHLAAARQNEAAMDRLRAFVEQARSPVENFSIAVREITNAGLNQAQQAVLVGQRVQEMLDTIPSGQLSGGAQLGSAEAITIANEAIARRIDGGPMERMRQALEVANTQRQQTIDLGREMLEAMRKGTFADVLGAAG